MFNIPTLNQKLDSIVSGLETTIKELEALIVECDKGIKEQSREYHKVVSNLNKLEDVKTQANKTKTNIKNLLGGN